MLEGKLPTKELFAMPRNVSDDMLKRDSGTVPDKLLIFMASLSSVGIWPRLFGMLPNRSLYVRRRSMREDRFPSEEGIFPEIWLFLKSRY